LTSWGSIASKTRLLSFIFFSCWRLVSTAPAGGADDDPVVGQHGVEDLRVALDCGQAVPLRERRD
jgi:hypothetical protein